MIGFGATVSTMLYMYFSSVGSPAAEKDSKYFQRFHAKKEHH